MIAKSLPNLMLRCPSCAGDLEEGAERYRCLHCQRDYPIIFGIPDFRLEGDLYLTLEDERAKAARLHKYAQNHSFKELVDFYYSITDDVPPELAGKFAAYVHDAPERMRPVLAALGSAASSGRLLDIGCGSGGALIAGVDHSERIGVDIALRWLVICQKRLEELGIEAQLICADIEALPLAPGQFTHVLANDLLEHVRRPEQAAASCAAQLAPGGTLYVSASNRWWPGPHPAVGIWAAGLMPASLRSRVATNLRGVDVLRNAQFISASQVKAWLRERGLKIKQVAPKRAKPPSASGPFARSAMLSIYRFASGIPGLKQLMVAAGPAFEIIAERPDRG